MQPYETPILEFVRFPMSDILTTSGNPDELPDDDWL